MIDKKAIPVYSLQQNSLSGKTLIEVVRAVGDGRYTDPGFLIPHRKDYYLFVLVKRGDSRHWVDFLPYTVEPDMFYFTTPQQVHLKEEMKPMEGLVARFSDEFLQLEEDRMLIQLPVIQNPAGAHVLRLTPQDVLFAEDILTKLLLESGRDGHWKNPMLTALLRVLVIYLSRLYTEQYGEGGMTSQRSILQQFQLLINQHHCRLHDVASYARLLNLTPDHLSEVVKQQSGRTAITHIHQRILVEAKRHLLHTELSVKELADVLGFADAAYFTRWFRRVAAVTPVLYRDQIREKYR